MAQNHPLLALIIAATLGSSLTLAADMPTEPAKPIEAKAPIAVVNGVVIPAIYAEIVRQNQIARGISLEDVSTDSIRDALVNVEIQSQTATAKGLDKPENIRALLDLQRKETLVKLLQDDFRDSNKISDEAIQAEYDRLKARIGEFEYHARHILVKDEAQARNIIGQLTSKKPAKFEQLAKQYSEDGSSQAGGDLEWVSPGNLVPEFADAMVNLKKGEVTKIPVKTRFGWHVIKLEGMRKADLPELDRVKDEIAQQLMQIAYRKYLAELRSNAKIDIPSR